LYPSIGIVLGELLAYPIPSYTSKILQMGMYNTITSPLGE
jgi:hypothetical protein